MLSKALAAGGAAHRALTQRTGARVADVRTQGIGRSPRRLSFGFAAWAECLILLPMSPGNGYLIQKDLIFDTGPAPDEARPVDNLRSGRRRLVRCACVTA